MLQCFESRPHKQATGLNLTAVPRRHTPIGWPLLPVATFTFPLDDSFGSACSKEAGASLMTSHTMADASPLLPFNSVLFVRAKLIK